MVEHLICNQVVAGSSPISSSLKIYGKIPERPKGADCKSVAHRASVVRIHLFPLEYAGIAQWLSPSLPS